MKLFGIGLPRTGTTSLAVAAMELGYKTCHTCFYDSSFDLADAFFDTPVYADYPLLDRRFPGSKFILTYRDPQKWYRSFIKSLDFILEFARNNYRLNNLNQRCYIQMFGVVNDMSEDYLISRYLKHREEAEVFFAARKEDFLAIDITEPGNKWERICNFLGRELVPAGDFPLLNDVGDWERLQHENKFIEEFFVKFAF